MRLASQNYTIQSHNYKIGLIIITKSQNYEILSHNYETQKSLWKKKKS